MTNDFRKMYPINTRKIFNVFDKIKPEYELVKESLDKPLVVDGRAISFLYRFKIDSDFTFDRYVTLFPKKVDSNYSIEPDSDFLYLNGDRVIMHKIYPKGDNYPVLVTLDFLSGVVFIYERIGSKLKLISMIVRKNLDSIKNYTILGKENLNKMLDDKTIQNMLSCYLLTDYRRYLPRPDRNDLKYYAAIRQFLFFPNNLNSFRDKILLNTFKFACKIRNFFW